MRTTMRTVAALTGGLALVAAVAPLAPADAGPLSCSYQVSGRWNGGFTADLYIRNQGPQIDGWTVRWTFRQPATATSVWSANPLPSTPTEMAFGNAAWNGRIPTGGVSTFGWTAKALVAEVPTDVTVNGSACPVTG